MAIQYVAPGSGYRIFRDASSDIDANNPSAGLAFSPPVESDELFDELRAAHPSFKTHAQRKRKAILDFLFTELQNEAGGYIPATITASNPQSRIIPALPRPDRDDFHASVSGSDSQYSTANSPVSNVSPPMLRSTQVPTPVPTITSSPRTATSVPAMENMVSIWRTSDGRAPTRKRRRQMNDRERQQYKRKRQEGACDSCKMHKRKCTHQSRVDDDASNLSERPIRRRKIRQSALATPGPDTESPTASQLPMNDQMSSQPPKAPQMYDASSAAMPHGDSPAATEDMAEHVPTQTLSAKESSVGDQTNGQMYVPASNPSLPDASRPAVGAGNRFYSPRYRNNTWDPIHSPGHKLDDVPEGILAHEAPDFSLLSSQPRAVFPHQFVVQDPVSSNNFNSPYQEFISEFHHGPGIGQGYTSFEEGNGFAPEEWGRI